MKYQKSEKGRLRYNIAHSTWKVRTGRKSKQKAITYKGGKCSRCGYDKCAAALEFHHLNPAEKKISIAVMCSNGLKFDSLKIELDKCILLCANCHRELHSLEV